MKRAVVLVLVVVLIGAADWWWRLRDITALLDGVQGSESVMHAWQAGEYLPARPQDLQRDDLIAQARAGSSAALVDLELAADVVRDELILDAPAFHVPASVRADVQGSGDTHGPGGFR